MFVSKFKAVVAVAALVVLLGAGAFTCGLGGRDTEPAKATAAAGPDDPTAQPEVKKTDEVEAEKALRQVKEEAEALRRQNERLQLELRKVKDEQAVLLARLEDSLRALKAADADREKLPQEAPVQDESRPKPVRWPMPKGQVDRVYLEIEQARGEKLAAELAAERKRRQDTEEELRRWRAVAVQGVTAEAEAALKEFREAKDKEAKRKALDRLQQALDRLKDNVKE
jgi:dTMP kinase